MMNESVGEREMYKDLRLKEIDLRMAQKVF